MHASGEPASTIATELGVSRATVGRLLANQATWRGSQSSASGLGLFLAALALDALMGGEQ
jgi:DNA invertase Pin-like site-specific DNA recombinase